MTLTLGDLGAIALALVGAILTILNIIDKVIVLKTKADEPERIVENRVTALEKDVSEIKRYLDNDKKSIDELRASNNIILRVLFALLNHEVTGNSIDKLKEIQTDLQDFLANRGISV